MAVKSLRKELGFKLGNRALVTLAEERLKTLPRSGRKRGVGHRSGIATWRSTVNCAHGSSLILTERHGTTFPVPLLARNLAHLSGLHQPRYCRELSIFCAELRRVRVSISGQAGLDRLKKACAPLIPSIAGFGSDQPAKQTKRAKQSLWHENSTADLNWVFRRKPHRCGSWTGMRGRPSQAVGLEWKLHTDRDDVISNGRTRDRPCRWLSIRRTRTQSLRLEGRGEAIGRLADGAL